MRLDELEDVDVSRRDDGATLAYEATRNMWRASNQATTATKGDIATAIAAALATLRVQ